MYYFIYTDPKMTWTKLGRRWVRMDDRLPELYDTEQKAELTLMDARCTGAGERGSVRSIRTPVNFRQWPSNYKVTSDEIGWKIIEN